MRGIFVLKELEYSLGEKIILGQNLAKCLAGTSRSVGVLLEKKTN